MSLAGLQDLVSYSTQGTPHCSYNGLVSAPINRNREGRKAGRLVEAGRDGRALLPSSLALSQVESSSLWPAGLYAAAGKVENWAKGFMPPTGCLFRSTAAEHHA